MPRLIHALPALVAAFLAPAVFAQEAAQTRIVTPDEFTASAPANALDIVRRLPGFTLIEPDADVRGYAGAQGNVLIDGARPASKRESLEDLLRRIPAGAVARVELIHAGAGVDMGGHAVIANVVRAVRSEREAALETGIEFADGRAEPRLSFDMDSRRGDRALTLAAAIRRETEPDTGRGGVRATDPAGDVLESFHTDAQRSDEESALSIGWRGPAAGGRLYLDAALRHERESGEELIVASDGSSRELVQERERYSEAEAALRYERALGARTGLELIASQQIGRLAVRDSADEDGDIESREEEAQSGESIARIELTQRRSDRLDLRASLEGAFNFLESESELHENGVLVPVPGSDVRVEERRAEAAFDATWRPRAHLTLQSGLRLEASRLSQTGDTELERTLTYAKPRLALDWQWDERTRVRASASREVGQLDFGDFVSTTSFSTNSLTAGAADLEPEAAWRYTLALERRIGAGSVTLTLTHEDIDNAVDRVMIDSGGDVFDAPGNIGAGERNMAALDITAPLDALGLAGVRFDASALWRASRVRDPITGIERAISDEPLREGDIRLTHVLTGRGLSWGARYKLAERERRWRYHSIVEERDSAALSLFAEQSFDEGRWRLRADVYDPFGRDFDEIRTRHNGPRAGAPLSEIERRGHTAPPRVLISLRRNMGG